MADRICETHGTPLFPDKNGNAWCPDCLKSSYGGATAASVFYHYGLSLPEEKQ